MSVVDCSIFTMSLSFSEPDRFAAFVPAFYDAIAAMEPLPAEIVIACPRIDYSGVDSPPAEMPTRVRIVRVDSRHPSDFLQAAVDHARTKWLSWCGIDDRVTPAALQDIPAGDAAGADVISAKYLGDGALLGEWSPHALAVSGVNTIAPNSPFTKAAFVRAGGWPRVYFDDWGLWLRMIKAGVSVLHTDTVGLVMDLGHNHDTRSGARLPKDRRDAAVAEIRALADELWPGGYR